MKIVNKFMPVFKGRLLSRSMERKQKREPPRLSGIYFVGHVSRSSIVTRKGYRGQLRFYYSYDMGSALAETIKPRWPIKAGTD